MTTKDYGRFLEADYVIGGFFECMFLDEYRNTDTYDESTKRFNYFVNNIDSYAKSLGMDDNEKDALLSSLSDYSSFNESLLTLLDKKMYSDDFYIWEECQDRYCESALKKLKDFDTMYLYKSKNGLLNENDVKDNGDLVSDFVKTWVGLEFKVLEYNKQ